MRRGILSLFVALYIPLTGCFTPPASAPPPETTPSGLIVTPESSALGKVVHVNLSSQYVIVGLNLGQKSLIGQRCNVYRRGLKVAEIQITGPEQSNNTAADILTGRPLVGDLVLPN